MAFAGGTGFAGHSPRLALALGIPLVARRLASIQETGVHVGRLASFRACSSSSGQTDALESLARWIGAGLCGSCSHRARDWATRSLTPTAGTTHSPHLYTGRLAGPGIPGGSVSGLAGVGARVETGVACPTEITKGDQSIRQAAKFGGNSPRALPVPQSVAHRPQNPET